MRAMVDNKSRKIDSVEKKRRRAQATLAERRRFTEMNAAYESLRQTLPTELFRDQGPIKINILRNAIKYIAALRQLLQSPDVIHQQVSTT